MRRVASDPETGIGAPFSGGFELANLILKIPFGISAELPLGHVETAALGLCVHVTDVIGDRLFSSSSRSTRSMKAFSGSFTNFIVGCSRATHLAGGLRVVALVKPAERSSTAVHTSRRYAP